MDTDLIAKKAQEMMNEVTTTPTPTPTANTNTSSTSTSTSNHHQQQQQQQQQQGESEREREREREEPSPTIGDAAKNFLSIRLARGWAPLPLHEKFVHNNSSRKAVTKLGPSKETAKETSRQHVSTPNEEDSETSSQGQLQLQLQLRTLALRQPIDGHFDMKIVQWLLRTINDPDFADSLPGSTSPEWIERHPQGEQQWANSRIDQIIHYNAAYRVLFAIRKSQAKRASSNSHSQGNGNGGSQQNQKPKQLRPTKMLGKKFLSAIWTELRHHLNEKPKPEPRPNPQPQSNSSSSSFTSSASSSLFPNAALSNPQPQSLSASQPQSSSQRSRCNEESGMFLESSSFTESGMEAEYVEALLDEFEYSMSHSLFGESVTSLPYEDEDEDEAGNEHASSLNSSKQNNCGATDVDTPRPLDGNDHSSPSSSSSSSFSSSSSSSLHAEGYCQAYPQYEEYDSASPMYKDPLVSLVWVRNFNEKLSERAKTRKLNAERRSSAMQL